MFLNIENNVITLRVINLTISAVIIIFFLEIWSAKISVNGVNTIWGIIIKVITTPIVRAEPVIYYTINGNITSIIQSPKRENDCPIHSALKGIDLNGPTKFLNIKYTFSTNVIFYLFKTRC